MQSLIPALDGQLTRELGEPLFLPTVLGAGAKIGALYEYDFNNGAGVAQRKYFAATATQLFVSNGSAWVVVTLPTNLGLTSTSALTDYPQFVTWNNLLHVSDGATNWLYDGPNNQWVIEGFPIPLDSPVINTSNAGTLTIVNNRFYWFTFSDQTPGRVHESSSSFGSAGTGAITSKEVIVTPTRGTFATTSGSPSVVGTGTNFLPSMVGMLLYGNGFNNGPIASVQDTTHLTLANNVGSTVSGILPLIVPVRTTHVNVYASEVETSKIGQFLASILVTSATPSYTDQSPFSNQASSLFIPIQRPIRNDPAPFSKILEVHKFRIFRRRETRPNFFNFTANEEVSGIEPGAPSECVPGADVNTLSDIIDEDSYPKQSNRVRALASHGDALYIGTEKDTTPLYGESIDDFAIAQVVAFSKGIISRWGMVSTSHGLVMFTYDRKMTLYPEAPGYLFQWVAETDQTQKLQEIGRPMRKKFANILSSDLDNVRVLWYNYENRDWLVVCFQDKSAVYHTWIYDFETKGWFELQRGFVSVGIFEVNLGDKILVGGGTDGLVYVIDDLTGTYAPPATLPAALYRTSLIDFGKPGDNHIPRYVEYEITNDALAQSIVVNFYLDPIDADSPGAPRTIYMRRVPNTACMYRGFFGKGVLCQRLMVEFNVKSDINSGALRGVMLKADPASRLAR